MEEMREKAPFKISMSNQIIQVVLQEMIFVF